MNSGMVYWFVLGFRNNEIEYRKDKQSFCLIVKRNEQQQQL